MSGPGPALRPAATFFGAPIGDLEDLGPGRVAVAGLHLDHPGGPPGARLAARQLRYASTPPYSLGRRDGHPPGRPQTAFDIGDLNVFPLELERTEAILTEQAQTILTTGARLLCLGGGYSATAALVRGAVEANGRTPTGFIRLTARLATGSDDSAVRIGALLPGGMRAIALLGVTGAASWEAARALAGALVLPAASLRGDPGDAVDAIRAAWRPLPDRFYLSVDAKVLSALPVERLLCVIESLRALPFTAAEVNGFLPDPDVAGRPAVARVQAVARAVLEVLTEGCSRCP